jgi:hypothetical protein
MNVLIYVRDYKRVRRSLSYIWLYSYGCMSAKKYFLQSLSFKLGKVRAQNTHSLKTIYVNWSIWKQQIQIH